MQTTFALLLICLVASFIEVTHAQSIHVVKVGDSGSFYDPQVTSARAGDLVSFQWTGAFHSVTQSSFDNPCTPLSGGFDSGVAGNPPQQFILPEWNLTITDDTQPIWFFCKVSIPVLHCSSGMVGAINAGFGSGNQSFDTFTQNAKSIINASSIPKSPPVLTGVGAFALSTPIPVHNVTNVTSAIPTSTSTSSSDTSTSSSTPPPAQTQQNSSSSRGLSAGVKGGIAGGSAGLLVLVILLALLFISYRRGKRYRKEAKAIRELRSKSSRDMSHIDPLDVLDPRDLTPSQQVIQLHRSQGAPSISESLERDSTSPSINIKELAAEIARNMRQEINSPDRDRSGTMSPISQDLTSLSTVPEQLVANAVSRSGSSRVTELGRGRQLPRPPQTRADVRSVDTLPAYVPGHPR